MYNNVTEHKSPNTLDVGEIDNSFGVHSNDSSKKIRHEHRKGRGLFNGVGGTDDNFQNTVFDDNAPTPITKARAPYRGAFRPQALDRKQPGLAAFRGKNSKGTWQLVIGGPRNSRFGMLHQWGLTVETQ